MRGGELAQGQRPVAQLEEDFSATAAQTKSECLGEFASAVMRFDELVHEGPGAAHGVVVP